MQSSDWPEEHSVTLRDLHAKGMSYAQIAKQINARFGTTYTRNAAISRGKRMGLAESELAKARRRADRSPDLKLPRARKRGRPDLPTSGDDQPAIKRIEPVKLRCVGVNPRLITLLDLEAGDCRYPYGGDKDGDSIVFCGHPRRPGSQYCTPHFHLTRDPEGLWLRSAESTEPLVPHLVVAA
jgi:GcrA cell cycle regulator